MKSEGNSERVRRDVPTHPLAGVIPQDVQQRSPPLWKDADPTFFLQKKQGGAREAAVAGKGSFHVAERSRIIGTNGCSANACRLFEADHGQLFPNLVLLKHSIVPSERSLEPETCMELRAGALYLKHQVRQAKADFPLVL